MAAKKTRCSVEVDGKEIWADEFPSYAKANFPPELLGRPESGTRTLLVNGVVIGVQAAVEVS